MATGQEPVSAANAKALYQKIAGGGVAPSWISDLKELRKEMGLGDTLGVLPIENMQLKVSDEVSGLSAADGYAISPKGVYDFMNELLNREKSGASVYFSGSDLNYITVSSISKASCDGDALTASTSGIFVKKSGRYTVSIGCKLMGRIDGTSASVGMTCSSLGFMAVASVDPLLSKLSDSYSSVKRSAAGSLSVFLKKGETVKPSVYVENANNGDNVSVNGTLSIVEE